jgi:pimeloyl-ACP methyl ester carboxylesterase
MVLVDPGSEWQMARTGETFTREMKDAVAAKASLLRGMGAESARGTFARNLSLVEQYVNPRLPSWEYHAYRALWATEPWFWNACANEGEGAVTVWDEVARGNITSLGEIPLVVISSGQDMGFSADAEDNIHANTVFRNLQKEMATESPKGRYLIAENSSHYIQIDEPDLVTGSIRSVVRDIRTGP